MELEKGKCFCCGKTEIISIPPKTEIQKILICLFTEKIFNINALKEYASVLRLCPSCLHKLILLQEASKQINSNEVVVNNSNTCLLCGKNEYCIKVSNSWNHFKEISEDYSLFANTSEIVMCSGCIFYLDTRNTMKIKLCSQYPQLKEVPILKLKLKEVHTQSTPTSEKKIKRISRAASVEIINVSSDSNVSSIDLSPLKGLTALKNDELLVKPKSISSDSKFMNQILYVKMNKHNFLSSTDINRNKNKESQIDSVGSKSTNKRRNMNRRRLSVTLHNGTSVNKKHKSGSDSMSSPNKYSRIKSNAEDRDNSTAISKERNTFFKIKLKKNTKSSQTTNKQRAHKKKYMQFMEPDFNRKLIINILRCDVETFQSSNVDDLSTEKLDTRERSNTDSSLESLLLVVDEIGDETTPDDIENSPNNSIPDTEKNEQEKLDSNETETNDEEAIEISANENCEEESKEKCETITNEPQKDIIGKDVVSEDTDSDKTTVSTEGIKKMFNEKESETGDSTKKETTIAVERTGSDENHAQDDGESDESPKENSLVETDDQCKGENKLEEEFKEIEDGGPSITIEGLEKNFSISGKNDKEKEDLNNEDKDQTNDMDNSEVNEIKDEIGSIRGNNEKIEDLNDEDEDQTKDTGMNESDANEISDDLKDADMNNKENETDGCLKGVSTKEIEDDLNNQDDNLNDEDKVNTDPDSKDMQNTSDMENRISNEESIERSSPREMFEDTNTEKNDQTSGCNKRKRNGSTEDASSPDRKKKKVTFSDEILESID